MHHLNNFLLSTQHSDDTTPEQDKLLHPNDRTFWRGSSGADHIFQMGLLDDYARSFSLSGNIRNYGSADGQITAGGGDQIHLAYQEPTVEISVYVSSSSLLDDCTVLLSYLDDDFIQRTATVVVNGQTQVLIATDVFRTNGSLLIASTTLTDSNIGNIYIAELGVTAGVPDDLTKVHSYISPGFSSSSDGHLTIPDNYAWSIVELSFSGLISAASKQIRIILSIKGSSGVRYKLVSSRLGGSDSVISNQIRATSFSARDTIEVLTDTDMATTDFSVIIVGRLFKIDTLKGRGII